MSATQQDHGTTAANRYLNRTAALGMRDQEMNAALFEFKVFNITVIALAVGILTFTGLYCISLCYIRTRLSKRAQVYESAVSCDEPVNPVAVKAVKRSTSFMNPFSFFKKPETARDNSRIYFIYSNPLPIGVEEEATAPPRVPEEETALSETLTFQEYAKDSNSGVVLDPPIFYMQL